VPLRSMADVLDADREARRMAHEEISKRKN